MAEQAFTAERSPPPLKPPGGPRVAHVTRRLDQWALNPVAPVIGTVAIAVAGLTASVWAPELGNAFPIAVGEARCAFDSARDCELVGPAITFWSMALLGAITFGWREWVKGRNEENVQRYLIGRTLQVGEDVRERTAELASQAAELHARARTLPPDDFLQHYRVSFPAMHEMLKQSLLKAGEEDAETLAREIQQALATCILLAKAFEQPQDRHGRWAANIMVFLPIARLTDEDLARSATICPYNTLEFNRPDLAGVLFTRTDLSLAVTVNPEGGEEVEFPDPQLPEIALPVPNRPVTDSLRMLRVLPGAPYALYGYLPAGYADTRMIGNSAEAFCDLPPGTKQAMADYFQPDNNPLVRSLISMPLLHDIPGDQAYGMHWTREVGEPNVRLLKAERLPSGVLNIHRDRERMACTDERAELFYPVLVPMLGVVRDLVDLYDAAEADQGFGPGPGLAGTSDPKA